MKVGESAEGTHCAGRWMAKGGREGGGRERERLNYRDGRGVYTVLRGPKKERNL